MAEPTRLCCRCKRVKPLKEYNTDRGTGGLNGLHRACRECQREKGRIYYGKNRERIKAQTRKRHDKDRLRPQYVRRERSQRYRRNYGITVKQYDQMVEDQNGTCAICGFSEFNKRLAVDHDHITGQIRGLLCAGCNTRLGILENDEFCTKAKKYLRRF